MKRKKLSGIRQAVESLECRRLMSTTALYNWSKPYVTASGAFPGETVGICATVAERDAWGNTISGELPETVTTQFALSVDDVAGNADDIPLGSAVTPHTPSYGGSLGWEWYSASRQVTLPADIAPGKYRAVSYTAEAGYQISDTASFEVLGGSGNVTMLSRYCFFHQVEASDTELAYTSYTTMFKFVNDSPSPATLSCKVYLSTDDVLDAGDILQVSEEVTLNKGDNYLTRTGPKLRGAVAGEMYRLIFVLDRIDSPLVGGPIQHVTSPSFVEPLELVPPERPLVAPLPPEMPEDPSSEQQPSIDAPSITLPSIIDWEISPELAVDPPESKPDLEPTVGIAPVEDDPDLSTGLTTETVNAATLKRGKVKFQVRVTNTSDGSVKGPATFSVAVVNPETNEVADETLTFKRRVNLDSGESKVISYRWKPNQENAAALTVSSQLAISTSVPSSTVTGAVVTDELFCAVEVLG